MGERCPIVPRIDPTRSKQYILSEEYVMNLDGGSIIEGEGAEHWRYLSFHLISSRSHEHTIENIRLMMRDCFRARDVQYLETQGVGVNTLPQAFLIGSDLGLALEEVFKDVVRELKLRGLYALREDPLFSRKV